MALNVNDFVKESLKVKGSIDVKRSTAEKLKQLEKNGVQIGLLIAGLLEDLDLDGMLKSLENEDAQSGYEVREKSHSDNGVN
jgi:hypothetical protein